MYGKSCFDYMHESGDTAISYVCNDVIHDVSRNSSEPAASGKIPEVFKASFVVTA